MEPKSKKVEKEKMDKLRSIGKQSWESVESVATVVWCILDVSCRTAAAASILHCNPKNED